MTSCNIIKEIYYLINKKVILYINYNFHNDVQHIKQIPDFTKFHELPYKKLTGDYLIRLINNDVNTIKLTIIMNHDLLAAICIVNGIRNRSVYIQDSENKLIAVGVYDNRFYGKTPEQTVKSINQSKVPNWQKSMSQKYIGMQYLRAVNSNSTLYHEAFIGF